ncbi:MAG: hypothetical protein KBD64_05920, partial [Gammaproteobacteria bacterium]|nr:hypothetical protein [Gammaproteobacteria bacterium]
IITHCDSIIHDKTHIESITTHLNVLTESDKEYLDLVVKSNPDKFSAPLTLDFKLQAILDALKVMPDEVTKNSEKLAEFLMLPFFKIDCLYFGVTALKEARIFTEGNYKKILAVATDPDAVDNFAGVFQLFAKHDMLNQENFDNLIVCEPIDAWKITFALDEGMIAANEKVDTTERDRLIREIEDKTIQAIAAAKTKARSPEAAEAAIAKAEAETVKQAATVTAQSELVKTPVAADAEADEVDIDMIPDSAAPKSSWKPYIIAGGVCLLAIVGAAAVCIFVPVVGVAVVNFFIATGTGLLNFVGLSALAHSIATSIAAGVTATVIAPIVTLGGLGVAGKFAYDAIKRSHKSSADKGTSETPPCDASSATSPMCP